jgi:solute carrier family 25 carnitine/acylcarnitine transporter 20/29
MTILSESFGGFSAGIVGTVVGFPLDLVKTRMQTSAMNSSLVNTFRHIVRNEGVPALYKGVSTPLLSLPILNTLNFTSYNHFKRSLGGNGDTFRGVTGCFAAGSLAGPIASIISTPEHMLKTQMQIDNKRKGGALYTKGSLSAAKNLFKSHGISALYRGHTSNTIRECAFLGIYFSTYEILKAILPIPIAGGFAGACGWVISYPLDCIKANVQGSFPVKAMSILDTGKQIFKDRGGESLLGYLMCC